MECYNCNSNKLKYNEKMDAYVCLDCGYEFPKQYFFISHSHLDIEKVRIIRNIIEETFFYEPILFFLKCLSNDEEINDLIQREINERIWFVYCKSKNAEDSKYVQAERQYINHLIEQGVGKNLLEIELDKFEIWDEKCYDYIRQQISYQIRKTKIFLSYSMKDMAIANALYDYFTKNGYSVWQYYEGLLANEPISLSINRIIKEHSHKDGIVIPILSENSLHNSSVLYEIGYAMGSDAIIIPVVIKDKNKPIDLPFDILNLTYYILDIDDIENSLNKIVEVIKRI